MRPFPYRIPLSAAALFLAGLAGILWLQWNEPSQPMKVAVVPGQPPGEQPAELRHFWAAEQALKQAVIDSRELVLVTSEQRSSTAAGGSTVGATLMFSQSCDSTCFNSTTPSRA